MDAKLAQLINSRRIGTIKLNSLTKDQQEFLISCRHNDYPVTYPDMIALWKELKWGEITESVLRRQVRTIEQDKKLLAEILARLNKGK